MQYLVQFEDGDWHDMETFPTLLQAMAYMLKALKDDSKGAYRIQNENGITAAYCNPKL